MKFIRQFNGFYWILFYNLQSYCYKVWFIENMWFMAI